MSYKIAFASLKGGTGRTTLTASLSAQLSRNGRRAMAFELDPQNALALHHGQVGGGPGLVDDNLSTVVVAEHLADIGAEFAFLPFGATDDEKLQRLEVMLDQVPSWLDRRIAALSPPACELVVIDTPAQRSGWLYRALELADLILVPLLPDAASYATIPAFEELARRTMGVPAEKIYYLVNQFNPARLLAQDMMTALKGLLGERVLPVVIHDDESAREHMAQGHPLPEGAASQFSADIDHLARWVVARATGQSG